MLCFVPAEYSSGFFVQLAIMPGPGSSKEPSGSSIWKQWTSLQEKSQSYFAKLHAIPSHKFPKWEQHFQKAFEAYTQLWRFQQEHRQVSSPYNITAPSFIPWCMNFLWSGLSCCWFNL